MRSGIMLPESEERESVVRRLDSESTYFVFGEQSTDMFCGIIVFHGRLGSSGRCLLDQ